MFHCSACAKVPVLFIILSRQRKKTLNTSVERNIPYVEPIRNRGSAMALCAFLLLFSLITLSAQPRTGMIRLQVTDPSAAAVETSGTLKNLESGKVQSFRTDTQGRSSLQALPFGHYRIDVSRIGFATQSVTIDVQFETQVLQTMTLAILS